MGRNRKDFYWGTNAARKMVSDRTSKSARPWNHPQVVEASTAYGVNFASHNEVASHEDKLESMGSLKPHERMTCIQCGRFNKECSCTEEWK